MCTHDHNDLLKRWPCLLNCSSKHHHTYANSFSLSILFPFFFLLLFSPLSLPSLTLFLPLSTEYWTIALYKPSTSYTAELCPQPFHRGSHTMSFHPGHFQEVKSLLVDRTWRSKGKIRTVLRKVVHMVFYVNTWFQWIFSTEGASMASPQLLGLHPPLCLLQVFTDL